MTKSRDFAVCEYDPVSELHHRTACHGDLARDASRAALEEMECGVLLHIRVFRRQAIDWDDRLVAALRSAAARANAHALERSAADNDRLDPASLQLIVQIRADKFVWAVLARPFAIFCGQRRIDLVRSRGHAVAANEAVPHQHSGFAR